MLFTFLITKKVHETYWCSGSIACQEKRTDWTLRIFTCNEKNPLYLPIISTLQFFWGSKWSKTNPITHKTIWHIPNMKNSEFKIKNNARFLKNPFYFSFNILGNTSDKFWDQSPSPPVSRLFASIWGSFLAQASVLLLCQYTTKLSRGERPDLFLQSGPFQNFQKFFQELSWSQ